MSDYKVDLDVYNGPMDLLLFLIRRDEVDIYDIPIAQITEQYVAYVSLIERMDPNLAGEFLVMAATLMEIKSRTLLPRPPVVEEEEDDFGDPRLELIRQLLEYKKYKDAAKSLDAARVLQSMKFKRSPVAPRDEGEVDLDEVQIWDLFDAFQGLLEATGRPDRKHEIYYDDTPIALHAADILDSLQHNEGKQTFQKLFEGRSKAQLIGLFLALLELIRQKRVKAVQPGTFAAIELRLLNAEPIFVNEAKDYTSAMEAYRGDEDDEDQDVLDEDDLEGAMGEGGLAETSLDENGPDEDIDPADGDPHGEELRENGLTPDSRQDEKVATDLDDFVEDDESGSATDEDTNRGS